MIGVIGAGAFGTSLAISLALGKTPVTLFARTQDAAHGLQQTRKNARYLGDAAIPEIVQISSLDQPFSVDDFAQGTRPVFLLSVPMQKLRSVLKSLPQLDGAILVACCKGIELTSGQGPVQVISEEMPNATPAILTGPSFAMDIARGLPTALTLACADADICTDLQQRLIAPNLRLYRTQDTIGAELGGALKNVMAIACGAAIGAGLGDSARAALMTRGFAEMSRMAKALGGRSETLAGLSGFGDLTLTCSSEGSRNFRFGLSLGREEGFDSSITVEGAATARATLDKARDLKIDMPITASVVKLLDHEMNVREVVSELLARPPKEE